MPDDSSANDNGAGIAASEPGSQRIFVFKSETRPGLRAFCADLVGSRLPSQFKPWRVTGAIAPGQASPYSLSRESIEAALRDQGFQLWRVKKKD
jgi:hypothetical protein